MVGGLAVSQILTAYTTPVVYFYLDRLQAWLFGTIPSLRKDDRSAYATSIDVGAVAFGLASAQGIR